MRKNEKKIRIKYFLYYLIKFFYDLNIRRKDKPFRLIKRSAFSLYQKIIFLKIFEKRITFENFESEGWF